MTIPISDGARNLFYALNARGHKGVFPPSYSLERAKADETTQTWFRRCVNRHMNGDPTRCAIDDEISIGVMGISSGSVDGQLLYLNMQVVIVEADEGLLGLYHRDRLDQRVTYLRLDFDPFGAMGPLFREPQPHLHQTHDGPAWHAFSASIPVPQLVHFIFRNWKHDIWLEWARQTWDAQGQTATRNFRDDPFPLIVEAYKNNKIDTLRGLSVHVDAIRKSLKTAIDSTPATRIVDLQDTLNFGL